MKVLHLFVHIVLTRYFVADIKSQIFSRSLMSNRRLQALSCLVFLQYFMNLPFFATMSKEFTYTACFSFTLSANTRHLLNRSSSSLRPCCPPYKNLDFPHSLLKVWNRLTGSAFLDFLGFVLFPVIAVIGLETTGAGMTATYGCINGFGLAVYGRGTTTFSSCF